MPSVTLTIEISEVLFSAIQITATMSETTVNAFIGSALRETQVTFFAENSASPPDSGVVVVLDVRATPPPSKKRNLPESGTFSQWREARARGGLGPLQQAIVDRLAAAPTMCGVFDLSEVRKTMLRTHSGPAVSRAVHQFVRRGVLESMTPTAAGFQPDVAREGPVRFVRCAGGS